MGTVEYTNDLWTQDTALSSGSSSDLTTTSVANMIASVQLSGTVAEKAYLDRFDVVTSRVRSGVQRRILPLATYSEADEYLPTELAFGHLMMVAGINNDQYFWCNLCSAYTGDRVRKLAKHCDRVQRCVHAVNNLRLGLHPIHGTMLTIPPRRMVKADVGSRLLLLAPMFGTPRMDVVAWAGDGSSDDCMAVAEVLAHSPHGSSEE